MKRKFFFDLFLFLLLGLFLLPNLSSTNSAVSIVMSKRITPYETLASEISNELLGFDIQVYDLNKPISSLKSEVIVTIGQNAYKAILPLKGSSKLIYTMVLTPDDNTESSESIGVAMIPSPRKQLDILRSGLGIKSVSIFYNHLKSNKLVQDFKRLAPSEFKYNFIDVHSEKDFLEILENSFPKSEAILLIPDSTVLTEQGIKKLVLKSYENKVPIVGFSPMYIELGAVISISVSEKLTAKVVANLIKESSTQYWDRTDGLCYPRLCEIRFSKKAAYKLSINLNDSALNCNGCVVKGID